MMNYIDSFNGLTLVRLVYMCVCVRACARARSKQEPEVGI
jgi:hypothetical protein